ncbi:hypothetical protein PG993_011003 [Apiospora rasikravindrae]|uniref:Uncharacterized protein n=1 Tax=Apiospora rasikravindrae TaxID=990691 RepID=A0ABR1SF76_9PEZI
MLGDVGQEWKTTKDPSRTRLLKFNRLSDVGSLKERLSTLGTLGYASSGWARASLAYAPTSDDKPLADSVSLPSSGSACAAASPEQTTAAHGQEKHQEMQSKDSGEANMSALPTRSTSSGRVMPLPKHFRAPAQRSIFPSRNIGARSL